MHSSIQCALCYIEELDICVGLLLSILPIQICQTAVNVGLRPSRCFQAQGVLKDTSPVPTASKANYCTALMHAESSLHQEQDTELREKKCS